MTIKNGELADADEVMNALGSLFNDTAQNIFNADYIGFDSRINDDGVPQYKNVIYSTFQTDDAISKTSFSYDSSGDKYDVTGSSAILVTGTNTDVGENITNVIPVVNSLFNVLVGDITNNSFEDAISTEWTYSETNSAFTGVRSATHAKTGTYGYDMYLNNSALDGTYCQILQNVDLTGADKIGAWVWHSGHSGYNNIITSKIIIDSTEIVTRTTTDDDSEFVYISGTIPEALRTSGKDVILRYVNGDRSGGAPRVYWDDVEKTSTQEPTLSFSNDGSTYESCENKKIHRPTTTGQKVSLKILAPAGAGISSYVSEMAIKYNLY